MANSLGVASVVAALPPYCVVIQYRGRERSYIRCHKLYQVRKEVVAHRKHPAVKFIYYTAPDIEFIEAYDARDPGRYV